jgi:hypothetical protein
MIRTCLIQGFPTGTLGTRQEVVFWVVVVSAGGFLGVRCSWAEAHATLAKS